MILHTLLLTATLLTQSVVAELNEDSITFSLPSPPQGVEYHNVEVWAEGSKLEVRQTGPTQWKVLTTANKWTFSYVECDDNIGVCTPVVEEWGEPVVEVTGIGIICGILGLAALIASVATITAHALRRIMRKE